MRVQNAPATLRDELLAEADGPVMYIAKLCGRAADELLIKQVKIEQQERELVKLRMVLKEPNDGNV